MTIVVRAATALLALLLAATSFINMPPATPPVPPPTAPPQVLQLPAKDQYRIIMAEGKLPDWLVHMPLSEEGKKLAREWARENTDQIVNGKLYHPEIREEWARMGLWPYSVETSDPHLSVRYIGTVIHGTTRPEHIVDAVWDLLPDNWQIEWSEEMVSGTDETRFECFVDIVEYLNGIAPNGCYFGTHPADGADWGFWPYDDD